MADAATKFKVGDRVKRLKGHGYDGVVKDLRVEVTAKSQAEKDKNLMVNVQWDNGTISYFCPESLILLK